MFRLAQVRPSAIVVAIGALTLSVYGPAEGATVTTTLPVSAAVVAECMISTTPLAFGTYSPITANKTTALNGTGGAVVTCTQGSASTVMLGQGANPAAGSSDTAPLRRMSAGGGNYLSYFLYSDAARSVVWGNTAATGRAHTGTGTAVTLTVYGQVPANQNVPVGAYNDSVVATVTF